MGSRSPFKEEGTWGALSLGLFGSRNCHHPVPVLPGLTRQAQCFLLSQWTLRLREGGSPVESQPICQGALPASPPSGARQPEPAPLSLSSLPSSASEPLLPRCLQPAPAHAGGVLPPCRGRQPGRAGEGRQSRDPPQDRPAGLLGLPAVAERQLHPPSTGTVPPGSESSPVRGHVRGILKSKVREEGTGPNKGTRQGGSRDTWERGA